MHLNGFFRISWLVQLLVGVALFGVSFLIESEVLRSFFSLPAIALTMAVALEVGKATSIIWHRYLSSTGTADYPVITRIFSSGFRIGLVGLSILCSALYLGLQLDRPNLEAVRNGKLAAIDARLQDELGRLDADRKARIAADRTRSQAEFATTRHDHQARIEALQAQLREEMMSGALLAEVAGSATRDDIRHHEAMDKVRKGADRVMERAHAGSQSGGGPQPGPATRKAA